MKVEKKALCELAEFFSFVLLGVFSAIALNYSMAIAPWGKSDTALYFNLARNIAAGNGFVCNYPSGRLAFVGLHPPFFSVILALLIDLDIPLISGIKTLNITLCIAILTGSGLWLRKRIKSWLAGFLVAVALFLHPDFFTAFNSAMSEPLYLFFALASLFTLLEGLLNPKSAIGWLIPSAILAGLAAFTRFIGVSSILLGCLAILLFSALPPKKKWLSSFVYSVFGSAPLLYWILVKWINYPGDTVRGLIFPSNFIFRCARLFFSVLDTISGWIPPASLITGIRLQRGIVVAALLLILGLFLAFNQKQIKSLFKQRDSRVLLLLASLLFILCYLIVFAISYLFSTISSDVYGRTLIPLAPCLLIALACLLVIAIQRLVKQKVILAMLISTIAVASFLPAYSARTLTLARENHRAMDSYLLPKYANSALMQEIKNLPEQTRLISNQAALILLYTGKYPYEFPELTCDAIKVRAEVPFGEGDTESDLRYRDGKILALFHEDTDLLFSLCFPADWAAKKQAFFDASIPLASTADGALYRYNPAAKGE